MPEGPSLVILRDEAAKFAGRKVLEAGGNSRTIDPQLLAGCVLKEIRTFGKNFLLRFPKRTLRVHFMLWGSYRVDEERAGATPRVFLRFRNGSIAFYACSVRWLDGELAEAYDWSADVMSDAWDPAAALRRLAERPEQLVCDALLDQNLFAGVGNIIKNEVLFRIRVHPGSTLGALPKKKLRELVAQAREYSFDFLKWKKAYVLKKHWQAHRQTTCPRCAVALERRHLGRTHRRTFWCESCQVRYGDIDLDAVEPLYAPRRRARKTAAKSAPRRTARKTVTKAAPRRTRATAKGKNT